MVVNADATIATSPILSIRLINITIITLQESCQDKTAIYKGVLFVSLLSWGISPSVMGIITQCLYGSRSREG